MKNIIIKTITILLTLTTCVTSYVSIYAHEIVLNVGYDDCAPPTYWNGTIISNRDGDDEMWYSIAGINAEDTNNPENNVYCEYHLNESINTITYYFEDCAENDPNYTWTTDIYKEYIKTMSHNEAMTKAEEMAEEIKEAYVNSIKKWNNIYYYSYDANGNKIANKIIDIVEGSKDEHNLSIYPIDYKSCKNNNFITFASTGTAGGETLLETNAIGMLHRHYTHWNMFVNVSVFFAHSPIEGITDEYDIPVYTQEKVNKIREFVGAHELGHVLGLQDVDNLCSKSSLIDHHEEILMGYGNGDRSTYAKYKDIAGVSITRGFHTDSDHIWILRRNIDGTNDVICALCNGVRYNITLTLDNDNNPCYESKQLNMYKSCVHHGGTNEEMLLVATDGIRNFFKCLYCRHIEEVDISTYHSAEKYRGFVYTETLSGWKGKYHKIVIYDRENYTFKSSENDDLLIGLYDENLNNTGEISNDIFTENGCTVELMPGTYYLKILNNDSTSITSSISVLPPPHIHSYTEWVEYSPTQHIECCECGATGTVKRNHVVKSSDIDGIKSKCLLCDALIDPVYGFGESFIQNISKVTINGSYILPNGIIVLVDEDIEAYFNGTLVFYDKNNLPQLQ